MENITLPTWANWGRNEQQIADELEDRAFNELQAKGIKHDSQKPRMSLLPAETLPQVIDVLEFGATKYAPDNWQSVPQPRTRYYDATMRHLQSWWSGEKCDGESGKPHLAHAICCLLFLLWFDKE